MSRPSATPTDPVITPSRRLVGSVGAERRQWRWRAWVWLRRWRPGMILAPITTPSPGATATSTDPADSKKMPKASVLPILSRSASRPERAVDAAKDTVYPKTIQPTAAATTPKVVAIAGWATAKADVFETAMPTATATSVSIVPLLKRPCASVIAAGEHFVEPVAYDIHTSGTDGRSLPR